MLFPVLLALAAHHLDLMPKLESFADRSNPCLQ